MDNYNFKIVMLFLSSYLIGSIPFSYLIGKLFYNTDIREHGSKNVGATNVFRVLGKKAGVSAMLLDAGKGYIAVLIADLAFAGYDPNSPCISVDTIYVNIFCGIFAVIGHNWTIFLKFKGGKGVATSIGVALGLVPAAAGVAFASFGLILFLTKYVSLSSMIGALTFFIVLIVFKESAPILVFGGLALIMIIVRHVPNIKRLLKGTENKIWQKK